MKKIISGYSLIFSYLGIFSILIGIINLLPLILIIFMPQEIVHAAHFLIPGLVAIALGLIVSFFYRGYEKGKLERHQDAVLVVFIWLLAIFISSFPFLLTGNFNFTQSVFETTSGYSTTGFTIVNVEQTPYIFLLFRSLLQFFGGVGLVLILTSAISDKFGMRLYSAEGHGDKLLPNLIRSARMILSIYVFYIIIGTLAYVFFGMSLFDAVNHSISAVATGGFSTKAASIGHYNSLGIEIVAMILMVLGGTNFFIHLLLFKKKLKNVISHIEIKLFAVLSLIFIPLFTYTLISMHAYSLGEGFRVGIFHFITTITTTGLQTVPSVNIFPVPILFATFLLMMIGAGIGSTAGGMKLYRVGLAIKSVFWNMRDIIGHKSTVRPKFLNRFGTRIIIKKEDIVNNYTFLFIYIFVLFIGIFIFTLYGNSLKDSIFEFTSILGTIGLSVGLVQYSSPTVILWTGIIGMLIARLESYVLILAISKIVMDLKKKKPGRAKRVIFKSREEI